MTERPETPLDVLVWGQRIPQYVPMSISKVSGVVRRPDDGPSASFVTQDDLSRAYRDLLTMGWGIPEGLAIPDHIQERMRRHGDEIWPSLEVLEPNNTQFHCALFVWCAQRGLLDP